MANDDKWNDEETWDSVADAPMSPTRLAELVAACDQRPELWKRCALALLEEQTLRHELQQMAREQLAYAPLTNAPLEQPIRQANAPLPCPARLAATSQVPGNHHPFASGRTLFWNNLALAASLLIVFGIGWQASQRFGGAAKRSTNQSPFSAADQLTQSATTPTRTPSSTVEPSQEVYGLERPAYATLDQAMIDQVNAETLASAMESDWPEELDPEYQQLRQAGYEVEAQKGLMPFWLHDGSSAVIPYQQIIVRPKSKSRNY